MTRQEMDAHLAGEPSKLLVSRVRAALRHYGIRPEGLGAYARWKLAWKWAEKVMSSYSLGMLLIGKPRKKNWPSASEIAAQYVALLLADMRDSRALHLPHRAADQLPPEVAVRLADANILALGCHRPQPQALPAAGIEDAEIVGG